MEEATQINFKDYLLMCSGRLEDGLPAAAVMIDLVELTPDGGVAHEETISLEDSCSAFTAYGDTLVMETVLSRETASRCLYNAFRALQEWAVNIENDGYRENHELHVAVMPLAVNATLCMVLHDVVYAGFYQMGGGWRLVTVYSISEANNSIEFAVDEGVDVSELVKNVDMEVERELHRLEEEYAEAEERLKKLQNENEYEKFLHDSLELNDQTMMPENRSEENEPEEDEDEDEYEEVDDYRFEGGGASSERDSWFRMSDD